MCQIWTAMIAALLLQYVRNESHQGWHMSNLVMIIRVSLMSYVNTWEHLELCFEATHSPPK